ncbi:MAG: M3 family oligoendopeptidase [Xylanivirga thermophila]|jgi:M3 family oligoendopeptidase|uniref:M3 family oligoendopeptidase n=1 Tax=Xylanivirga thermophila TaxID=2496273 RepID=UPI0039F5EF3C
MHFSEFKYERPKIEEFTHSLNTLIQDFETASTFKEQDALIVKINKLRSQFETMWQIATIRHTINTEDPFYEKENDYFDEVVPLYEDSINKYYKALVNSKYRNKLEEKWGKQLLTLAELGLKTFSPEIINDLQKENQLSSKYVKLIASAKIPFEGKDRNLSQMIPFQASKDRNMRIKAYNARYAFFAQHEDEIDSIYDELVKIRTKIAQKLVYKNFVELGYARMERSDYDANMVANFRNQVLEYIVPITTKLYDRQRNRLGLNDLKYYDESLNFKTGNPKPLGDAKWQVSKARTMYHELSSETEEFFNYMTEYGLLDLESKKGKAGGGYCTFISEYKAPFIFANFNGTSGDVGVLTHEAGHAFQVYCSREYLIPEYYFPTSESAEIHSMSMEFFTWPWMHLFFGDDDTKYKFSHLVDALQFIPYGVTVDEFQHFVYENPDATPAERKQAWRCIEKKYLPHRDYDDNDFLHRGGYWFQQMHIFESPFYYIDYTLAQVCAFQFWKKSLENHSAAWSDYIRLCKAGGTMSFLELVQLANLKSPFKDGCIQEIMVPIEKWLNSIDDTTF